jgi:Ser/Thr protein kinase RdoA (MazF antagonist)
MCGHFRLERQMFDVMRNRPHFTGPEAVRLARDFFGLDAHARPLPSERDQNFYLEEHSGGEFVLKIASAAEKHEVLDLQNQAMARLQASGIRCPRVCMALDGSQIAAAHDAAGTGHFVRLLDYIPGTFFAGSRPHTAGLLKQLGAFIGKIDDAFFGFSHPAANRELVWDIRRAGDVVRRCAGDIKESRRRALVETFLESFESQVVPRFPCLRQSIIHNDGNDYNVLVGECGPEHPGPREIAGIIDFGDMLYSCTAADPAIVAAYALLGKPDPLSAASQVIEGYHEVFPLTEVELEIMIHLVCMRLATSVALSAYQQAQEPENRYLSISEEPAWQALEKLSLIHPRYAHYTFRRACRLEPCPHTTAVLK